MKQPLYIVSATAISPQSTYEPGHFLCPALQSDNGKLFVIDAEYARHISPVAIRRMSRMLKIGITAGMQCLAEAGIITPEAIIIGTSRGSVTDMEHFMKDMIKMNEEALNPGSFIQSTYNSVNGWLAVMAKCKGYNQTYVHRGFSCELSLFDAQLTLAEATEDIYVLTGCFDELTDEYFTIRNKVDFYKEVLPPSLSLLTHYDTPGSIAGEGATFFTLSNQPKGASCAVHTVEMLNSPDWQAVEEAINTMLAANGLRIDDIDILLSGMNGDSRNLSLMEPLNAYIPPAASIAVFKHLCGEYATAAGFGLWIANYIFTHKAVPKEIIYRNGTTNKIRNLLLCNVTITNNVSLILVRENI